MDTKLFEQLNKDGLISGESLNKVLDKEKKKLFSIYWELKSVLYIGILCLTSALGILVYKNIDSIGHLTILCVIALGSAAGFYYCFRLNPSFTPELKKSSSPFYDYALLLSCLLMLIFTGYLQYQYKVFGTRYGLVNSFFAVVICTFAVFRYKDKVMTVLMCCSAAVLLFFILAEFRFLPIHIIPFIVMLFGYGLYEFVKYQQYTSTDIFHGCGLTAQVTALFIFYLAGNYFVVDQANQSLFNVYTMPWFHWIFWLHTIFIPVIYCFLGIRRKNRQLLIVGLLLIAVAVFSVRHYYHLVPIEWVLLSIGSVLIMASLLLHRFFRNPAYGISLAEQSSGSDIHNLESLIIAETFPAEIPAQQNTSFGGGSFGGGGSSGSY